MRWALREVHRGAAAGFEFVDALQIFAAAEFGADVAEQQHNIAGAP